MVPSPENEGGHGVARRRQRFPDLSGNEAIAALRWLVARGTIRAAHITDALKRREQLVEEIKQRLELLGGEGLRFLRGPEGLDRRPSSLRARKRVSAKARAAWKTQGRYLGAVRALSPANRAKVKAIREKSGVRAAITAAKNLGPKR
jgi:hypothetical protein